MSRRIIVSLVFILALTFMISCSGGNGNIVTPEPAGRDNVAVEASGGTLCMGLWQVVIDTETGTGDIVQLRSADLIINVLGFMEPPALNMMDLDWPNLVIDPANNIIEVGVILKHPIAGDDTFTGFDVRGVCFGPDVTNADGLTIVTSPQYFKGIPFGYQDGLLGAPDSVGHYTGLAGYKYFCDGLSATKDLADFFTDTGNVADRGSFGSGNQNQRDYILDWTDVTQAFFVFNYSIYANYNWPVGGTGLDDFDIATANSAEAFACKVTELANSLYYAGAGGGGTISLQVEAWDWLGDISNVTIESMDPGIITQTGYDVALGVFPSGASYGYEFYAVPGTPTEIGDLDILITVTDTKTFGECWFMDLLPASNSKYNSKLYNCFIHTTTVIDCPPAEVTGISPELMSAGSTVDDAEITGTFIDGGQLAAKLAKTGESDIVGTDVTFEDANTITADFNLAGAGEGLWDVVVTNGCGTDGTGVELVEVFDCGTFGPPSEGSRIYATWLYGRDGVALTRSGSPSYLVCRYSWTTATQLCAYPATAGSGYGAPTHIVNLGGGQSPTRDIVSDSENWIYLVTTANLSTLRRIKYTPGTGFGTMSTFATLPSGWDIRRITVDPDDNPVILSYLTSNPSQKKVFHRNGTDWDETTLPASFATLNIQDFDYNPVLDHYVFVTLEGGLTNMYAIDTDGDLKFTESDVFYYNHSYSWSSGIYIDQNDPGCHFAVWGGYGSNTSPRPVILFDATYSELSHGNGGVALGYGTRGLRGAWAPGTNRLFTGGVTTNVFINNWFALPSQW